MTFLVKNTKIQPYLDANFNTKKMENVKWLYKIIHSSDFLKQSEFTSYP